MIKNKDDSNRVHELWCHHCDRLFTYKGKIGDNILSRIKVICPKCKRNIYDMTNYIKCPHCKNYFKYRNKGYKHAPVWDDHVFRNFYK